MFSSCDSPIATTPPRSMALAISGKPQVHFVTPTTAIPWVRHNPTIVRALCSILSTSMVTYGCDMILDLFLLLKLAHHEAGDVAPFGAAAKPRVHTALAGQLIGNLRAAGD